MIGRWRRWLRDGAQLVHLSGKMIAGRRYWLAPLLVLLWPAYHEIALLAGWEELMEPADAQGVLIGFPLTVMGLGLGVRIIAADIDRRTLEISYTVPGGAHRVWIARLVAALAILTTAEFLLAFSTYLLFTDFPLTALYGALQPAVVYMVLAMGLSALFKSEATGALVAVVLLVVNGVFSGFGQVQWRVSPFWNPAAQSLQTADPGDVLAWTVQNRIGYLLIILALTALAFRRGERREKLLAG